MLTFATLQRLDADARPLHGKPATARGWPWSTRYVSSFPCSQPGTVGPFLKVGVAAGLPCPLRCGD